MKVEDKSMAIGRINLSGRGPGELSNTALLLALMWQPCLVGAEERSYIEHLSFTGRESVRFQHVAWRRDQATNPVYSVARDSRGFMWFGSSDGLHRYDGYRSKVYRHDPDDPHSIFSDNLVVTIIEDHTGALWFGTLGSGLERFLRSEERFEHFQHDPADPRSLSHDKVNHLLEDHMGVLWVATEGGLDRFDRKVEGSTRVEGFTRYLADSAGLGTGPAVLALYEDRSRNLWVGTDRGLARFERSSESFTFYGNDPRDSGSLSHDIVRAICEDGDGNLWIGTEEGLNRFDPGQRAFRRYIHDPADPASLGVNMVWALHQGREGDLWIGTRGGGVDRYHPSTGTFEHYRYDPADPRSVNHNDILAIYEDPTGILWFASYNGVDKYDRLHEPLENFTHRTLGDSNAQAIWEEPSGILWVGTDEGLNKIDRSRHTVVRYRPAPDVPGGLPHGFISALWRDRSGVLWVGTWGGLCRFDETHERFHCFRNDPADAHSLPSNSVRSLYEDRRGRLWIGTTRGVCELDPTRQRFLRLADEQPGSGNMEHERFFSITEDRTGALWFASSYPGSLYRLTDRLETFRHDPDDPDSLSSNQVLAVHEDRRGELWVATFGGGLNRLDRSRQVFVHYGEKDGLPSARVTGILEDERGHLWLGTYNGISRFDPQAESFHNYDSSDGLAADLITMYSFFRGPRGEMYFGGAGGLTAFFPDRLLDDPDPPPVVLTDFQIFNKSALLRSRDPSSPIERSILETHELVLSHEHEVFAFEFAALSYRSPAKNRYAYMLEGFDREWIPTDASHRFARYTNLDPGHYVFRVKASNSDGVWNHEGVTVAVTVMPPMWQTWWAYGLYGLAFSAVIAASFKAQRARRERERELQRKEAERDRQIIQRLRDVDRLKDEFLANTSHELRTPLYGMIGLAESLIDRTSEVSQTEIESHLAMLVASGRRLSVLVNDILDFSRLKERDLELDRRPVDLKALTDVVLTLVRPIVDGNDLALRNAVDAELPPAWADEDRLQQILLNLVGNAVKFTAEGVVEVSASCENDELTVRVRDTGIGIAPEKRDLIFQAFEQADPSSERRFGGSGLGLAVSEKLISLHGGKIWVDSTPGEGSTFSFTLPRAPHETAPKAPPELPTALVGPRSPLRAGDHRSVVPDAPRILVVDDEPINRQVLVNQLSAGGYRAVTAATGREALELLAEGDFDLVLLDIMMPQMSGFEVCQQIRCRHALEELPVIFLTAKDQPADRVSGFDCGANDFLGKPIIKGELLARVRTHLGLLGAHRTVRSQHRTVELQAASLEQQAALLARQTRELEDRNAELVRFTYTVSHDLKNPLTTIQLFLGRLEREVGPDSAGVGRNIERIRDAAGTLERLMGDLVELSLIGLEIRPESVNLGDVARSAAEGLAEKFAARGVGLEIARELPAVWGDRKRLREMMAHLLDNAVKFLGDAAEPAIVVGLRRENGEDVIFVRDNGQGIAARYHCRVFDLFEQLDSNVEGTGVGLALAKRVVEVHGGRVWVESEGDRRGSTFCFTLPGDAVERLPQAK